MPSEIADALDALVSVLEPHDAIRALAAAGRRARARLPPPAPQPTELMPPSRGGRVPPPFEPRIHIRPAPPGVVPGRPAPVVMRAGQSQEKP